MGVIIRHGAARSDLVEIVYRSIYEGTPATGRRFRKRAEATCRQLADMPGLGALYGLEHPTLADIRYFPIAGFKNYLVFYRPVAGGVELLRVLHGARDLERILAETFGIAESSEDEPIEP